VNIPPNVGPNENYMGVVSRGVFKKLIVISKELAKIIQIYTRNSPKNLLKKMIVW
jgi:hypothetical protein